MIKGYILAISALIFVSSAGNPELSPLDVIRGSNNKILDIYSANKRRITEKKEKEIKDIINKVTAFETISRRTIEKFCKKLKVDECNEFNMVFKRLLSVSSIKKLGRYRADRFDYIDSRIEDNRAVVRTIAFYKGEKVYLDYHLEIIDGNWMIVNYISDDVDTVRNYKKQFTRILKKESFSSLIKRLKKKIRSYEQSD